MPFKICTVPWLPPGKEILTGLVALTPAKLTLKLRELFELLMLINWYISLENNGKVNPAMLVRFNLGK